MVFNILAKDGVRQTDGNKYSLNRIIAFVGFLAMSGAFLLAAYQTRITAEMFVTYPLGLLILYVPRLAVVLLKIWKGVPETQ